MTTRTPVLGNIVRSRLVALATGAAVVWAVGPLASPASAAVPGLGRVVASSPYDMSSPKSVTASCPDDKRVIGTGAEIRGATGHVVLKSVVPDGALTSVRVVAQADQDGAPVPWLVRAYAICADPLPGLALVAGSSAIDSIAAKSATATCPDGRVVLGVGGHVSSGTGEVFLTTVKQNLPTLATAIAREDQDGYGLNWAVRAYAICAFPLAGLEQVAATTAQTSDSPKADNVSCPAGKLVLATGAEVVSGGSQVILSAMVPAGNLTGVTGRAYEDQDGSAVNWFLRTYAICAIP